eukprot:GHVT01085733.1.p1 GENE.GHVT01085733.1~~GHVT01085733.1.p1  ORF type:complete len:298 (-),score=55.69 GHVT01085733.1:32-925(-)
MAPPKDSKKQTKPKKQKKVLLAAAQSRPTSLYHFLSRVFFYRRFIPNSSSFLSGARSPAPSSPSSTPSTQSSTPSVSPNGLASASDNWDFGFTDRLVLRPPKDSVALSIAVKRPSQSSSSFSFSASSAALSTPGDSPPHASVSPGVGALPLDGGGPYGSRSEPLAPVSEFPTSRPLPEMSWLPPNPKRHGQGETTTWTPAGGSRETARDIKPQPLRLPQKQKATAKGNKKSAGCAIPPPKTSSNSSDTQGQGECDEVVVQLPSKQMSIVLSFVLHNINSDHSMMVWQVALDYRLPHP